MSHTTNDRRIIQDQKGSSLCLQLFARIGIHVAESSTHPSELVGQTFLKESVSSIPYDSFSDIILELRNVYSSSGMRCLRSDASRKKTPVINLLRQVAKANGLILESNRRSEGYTSDGKKRFVYWFVIRSMDMRDDDMTYEDRLHSTHIPKSVDIDTLRSDTCQTKAHSSIGNEHIPTDSPSSTEIITGTIALPDEQSNTESDIPTNENYRNV